MITSLFLRRLHRLRLSLPATSQAPPPNPFRSPSKLTTPFTASIYRLLCATTTDAQPPNSHFAVDYLIQSCGIPPDEATRVSKMIPHLKSPDKPDAVLRFLRQTGVTESDLRTALLRDPRMLCSSVEKNLRPNIAKPREVGLLVEDISGMISRFPAVLQSNVVPKVEFLMRALGSVENVSFVLTRRASVLYNNLEKVILPNLTFLQEECGLSISQIFMLIKKSFRLIQYNPELLKMKAMRAEELGVARATPKFVCALIVAGSNNQSTIDAKKLALKSNGFSEEEVNTLISNNPLVLMRSGELISRKAEFLLKEADCDKLNVVQNPALLGLSLEKRLMPRNFVRKLLKSKGLPVANKAFVTFVQPNEKQFLKNFVVPYEDAIPGLHRAYVDACSGKIGATEL